MILAIVVSTVVDGNIMESCPKLGSEAISRKKLSNLFISYQVTWGFLVNLNFNKSVNFIRPFNVPLK